MQTTTQKPTAYVGFDQDYYIPIQIQAFLNDRRSQNLTKGTLEIYAENLKRFSDFCDHLAVTSVLHVDASLVREYMVSLQATHTAGGQHLAYRTLRTFLYWWESEVEPGHWVNPIKKVKAPRVAIEPLEPADLKDITAILGTCKRGEYYGARDRAIFLCLCDTGVRAQEFCDLERYDLNLTSGSILVRRGKGRKPRVVYLGSKSRKAVRAYLKHRHDDYPALWTCQDGERLTYWGLREVVRRRAALAGVKPPSLHSFRRLFALQMLRGGADIYSLQRLMGHADLQVMRRYLALVDEDTAQAHRRASPVDNMM